MKIGIYDPYLDDLGGGEKYMMTIAECLSKNNDVTVFWDNKKDLEGLLQRFTLDLSRITIGKNIFAKNVEFFHRIFESRKYDAIIILSDGSIPFLLSKKTFLHIQQPVKNGKNNLKSWLKLLRISAIFYNSEFTKSFNKNLLPQKTKIIYPPVYLLPKQVNKQNIILHVGRFRVKNVIGIDDYKKQHIMIDVFKEMVDKGLKNWKFMLAVSIRSDDQEKFEEMKKRAEGYPIEFVINCSNKKLWDYYSTAKIYWHASGFGEDLDRHPEFAEHFGISTVEAMGAGAVPVVINAGGQKEIVTDGKNGFLWSNIEDFKKKTLQLIDDSSLMEKMSLRAKDQAKNFSEKKFCNDVSELVEK